MDYKLADKLKKAGYPQNRMGVFINKEGLKFSKCDKEDDCAYIPTLDELIYACGDEIQSVKKYDKLWHTNFNEEKLVGDTVGKNPLTAVAHLWIRIKEDDKI